MMEDMSLDDLMKVINLLSLENRRFCSAAYILYKLINNYLDCSRLFSEIHLKVPQRSLRHKQLHKLC